MLQSWVKELDSRILGSALASARRAYRMNRSGVRVGLNGTLSWQVDMKARNQVAELCDMHGSDKGSRMASGHSYQWPPHRYCEFYARMFDHCRFSIGRVFECGIGSSNAAISSSMGPNARAGASLRVWRDYFPNAQIYGADIDQTVLFQEDRIKTYFVDQMSIDLIEKMWLDIGVADFDLIIDDGLHTVAAAETLFNNSFSKLRQGGVYVVEDMLWEYAVSLCDRLRHLGCSPEIVSSTMLSGHPDSFLVIIRR
ncbi:MULTISPECIES: hypothetical protein [Aphanothece]|uniref:hypothetical protein n=1 Tax=Aphanothece TaxID=1121 RepID=UPI00398506E6